MKRFHHQYFPDEIQYEPGAFDEKTMQALEEMGYTLNEREHPYGNMQAILWNKETGQVYAASDPRHYHRYSARVSGY